VFLFALDIFIVNVALPSLQSGIGAGPGDLEWVVAAYALALAVLLLPAGRWGDRYGRRRAFMLGVAVFMVASVGCALAPTPVVLILSRFVQGVGAALLVSNMLSLIGVLFTGAARVRAIAVYGMALGVAAAGGQLIGGLLIAADIAGLGWRSIFAINVPIGLAVLILAPVLVPESRATIVARLDLVGAALCAASLGALLLPLIEGPNAGWPLWTWLLLADFPVLVVLTLWQQRRYERSGGTPLFPRVLFAVGAFRAGLAWTLVYQLGQASIFLVLAPYLQNTRSLTAIQAGILFAVMAVPYVVTSLYSPRLGERIGRRVLVIGAAALIAGYLALALAALVGAHSSILLLVPGLALAGAGQGFCIAPSTAIVLAHARPAQAGAVSGALSTTQQIGGAVGIALVGMVYVAVADVDASLAFAGSLAALIVVSAATIVLSRFLPAVKARS
jgi:EmrB/QacA subfamily drug resistance transporter